MKIKEIIVVEGRDDTRAVQQAVEADTLETGGSALNQEKIERIRLAQSRRGVIILTDPDYPGERIRKIISQAIPGCKHAFLPRHKALSKQGKPGVEHAAPEDIRAALASVRMEEGADYTPAISWAMIQQYGLSGKPYSQSLRAKMGERLGIGYCNAQQFFKRLCAFRITFAEFEVAYQQALQELEKDE